MKTVGILSFFPAFTPPRSGGELRLHYIAHRLADEFDVQMAAPTFGEAEQEEIRHRDTFVERRFPKTRDYNMWHRIGDRAGFSECSGWVCSHASKRHAALREEAQRLAEISDVYSHESPFLAPVIPRSRPRRQLLVYNSYNVETAMARDMFGNSPTGRWATGRIRRLERWLLRESDIVLACSDADGDRFCQSFGIDRAKITVIPNGVDVEALQPCPDEAARNAARERIELSRNRPAAFFIGSFHPPNFQAVDLIVHRLAPALPECDFLIAGKVCEAFAEQKMPENVRLLGLIDEETKQALFHGSDVALNPMLSGSGTNLKMLDYLACGLPVLSTPHGARGLNVESRRHVMVAEPELFAQALEELLADSALRRSLGEQARALAVEEYAWSTIGDKVLDLYTLKLGRRIIILNDYAIMPAEQGGQVRIEHVARRLSDEGLSVSLLTLTGDAKGRRMQPSPHLEELNIPRTDTHRFVDKLLARSVGCGADDTSALMFTRRLTPQFVTAFRREVRSADAVMLSHPYLEPLTRGLPDHVKLFYDSHNTEYELKQALYRGGPFSKKLIGRVRDAEVSSARRSQATFCVSEQNRRDLMEMVGDLQDKSFVCPNGVNTAMMQVRSFEQRREMRRRIGFGREFVAVFLGSGHPPNAEAAQLIIDKIARNHPRVLFVMVGSVSGWFWNKHLPGNVLLMGIVDAPVKNFLLQVSDFALNPMLTGSGTSLKLFDYMAAGLPVLSTAVGARGLDEEEMKAVVVLEPDEFSGGLRELLADPDRCEGLSRTARKVAEEHFDWRVTLEPMVKSVAEAIAQ